MSWIPYAAKVLATSGLVVAVTEVSNRSTLLAAILASVPLISVASMMWMHHDGEEASKIAAFSRDIVWLVIPSLLLFLLLPPLLERGMDFYPALGIGLGATIVGYLLMLKVMEHFGVASA